MREEVRQLIGWSLTQNEVSVRGETVRDDWLLVGQLLEDTDRGKVQRTWLSGARSRRAAMIVQFSMAGKPFAEQFALGSRQEAELTFWPGAYPQRAYMRSRLGEIMPLKDTLPGVDIIGIFLNNVAQALSCQPWLERSLCMLCEVTPICSEEGKVWYVRDREGRALPFVGNDGWLLLALSGGYPVDLSAEWDGECLRPLGALVHGEYTLLGRTN